ncbi:MAG: hypothetical protein U9N84_02055 [Actinomycetota bacterium]|nr:hypothetical protein [Actinomycetota bacterium]
MRDLRTQVESYAELLDSSTPPLEELFDHVDVAPPPVAARRVRPVRRPLVVAVGVAAAVVFAVGGLFYLGRGPTPEQAPAAPAVPESLTVDVLGSAPAITAESLGTDFVSSGGAVVADGTIHLFMVAHGEGKESTVRHATSPDGEGWSITPEPLLQGKETPYGIGFIYVDSAAIMPNGDWAIYFEVLISKENVVTNEPYVTVIGRATAPGPTGPWQVDPEPVLTPGEPGTWNGLRVGDASVVTHDGTVYMAFTGVDAAERGAIGWATSSDGVNWDVSTGPVIAASEDWHDGVVIRPDLVRFNDTWLMAYSGRSRNWRGLATSSNGLSWTKSPTEPVVSIAYLTRPQIRTTELVALEERLLLLVENGGPRTGSEITVLELKGY